MNGWRGRIGLIIPATNTIMEDDFWKLASDGISVHTARMLTKEKVTHDTLEAMNEDSKGAAMRVAQSRPDAIVFGCTSGSFLKGPKWNKNIEQQLEKIGKCPALTTTTASERALAELNVSKMDVISPYIQETNELLVNYFTQCGFTINNLNSFNRIRQYENAAIEPREIYRLAKKAHTKGSDGMFIACTQLRSLEVIEYLERDLKIPVIGANQATWWHTLKVIGNSQPVTGFGSLLKEF